MTREQAYALYIYPEPIGRNKWDDSIAFGSCSGWEMQNGEWSCEPPLIRHQPAKLGDLPKVVDWMEQVSDEQYQGVT
jgi:hypothetical protein